MFLFASDLSERRDDVSSYFVFSLLWWRLLHKTGKPPPRPRRSGDRSTNPAAPWLSAVRPTKAPEDPQWRHQTSHPPRNPDQQGGNLSAATVMLAPIPFTLGILAVESV